jgi:hypothetical protein
MTASSNASFAFSWLTTAAKGKSVFVISVLILWSADIPVTQETLIAHFKIYLPIILIFVKDPLTDLNGGGNRCAGIFLLLAFVRIKMVITKPLRITPFHFGINQTLPDHVLGHFFVIGPLLLPALTIHTDGLMIINR